ncbi:MAG: ABC transporter permease [Chloroflexi bacterium]|nr:ABC transporter permease [Chloroflexota bacterium]MCL5111223.1 ABC transporter permease [Chloroflexota bacterium]
MVLALLVIGSVAAPVVAPFDPIQISLANKLVPPTPAHLLGTDYFGRDQMSRVLYGGQVSLYVGLLVVVIAAAVGVPIGLVAGFIGGRVDNLLMRLMDALLTFPPLLLAVAIVGSLGADIQNVMLALGIVNIPIFARLVRGSTLALREEVYVEAARALGASPLRIVFLHILRNAVAPIVVQMTVTFSSAIISEASLSFLGLGAQPPTPSWGRDLNEARRFLEDAPWLLIAPTAVIMLSVLSVNFFGDGLRDALDPRSWRDEGKRMKATRAVQD